MSSKSHSWVFFGGILKLIFTLQLVIFPKRAERFSIVDIRLLHCDGILVTSFPKLLDILSPDELNCEPWVPY